MNSLRPDLTLGGEDNCKIHSGEIAVRNELEIVAVHPLRLT